MLASKKLFFQRVLTFHWNNFCTGMPSLLFMEDATIRWMMLDDIQYEALLWTGTLHDNMTRMTVTDCSPDIPSPRFRRRYLRPLLQRIGRALLGIRFTDENGGATDWTTDQQLATRLRTKCKAVHFASIFDTRSDRPMKSDEVERMGWNLTYKNHHFEPFSWSWCLVLSTWKPTCVG